MCPKGTDAEGRQVLRSPESRLRHCVVSFPLVSPRKQRGEKGRHPKSSELLFGTLRRCSGGSWEELPT